MVGQSRPGVLVASADLEPLARQVARSAPAIERVLLIDAPGVACDAAAARERARAADRAVRGSDVPWGGFDETSPCGLCFTSGTTGAPKGVTYTHRSSFLHTLRLLQADGMALSARDSVLAAVPMFHANAWGLPFAAPAAGAKLVLPGRHAGRRQPGVPHPQRGRDRRGWRATVWLDARRASGAQRRRRCRRSSASSSAERRCRRRSWSASSSGWA